MKVYRPRTEANNHLPGVPSSIGSADVPAAPDIAAKYPKLTASAKASRDIENTEMASDVRSYLKLVLTLKLCVSRTNICTRSASRSLSDEFPFFAQSSTETFAISEKYICDASTSPAQAILSRESRSFDGSRPGILSGVARLVTR